MIKVLALNDITSIDDEGEKKNADAQILVLHKVLASRVTKGYEDYNDEEIKQVNDIKVKNIYAAIEAIANSKNEFITLKLKSGQEIVVGNLKINDKALLQHKEILQQYDIVKMCSNDLALALEGCGIKRNLPAVAIGESVTAMSVETQHSVEMSGSTHNSDDTDMSDYEPEDMSAASTDESIEESKVEANLLSESTQSLLNSPAHKRKRVTFADDVDMGKENNLSSVKS